MVGGPGAAIGANGRRAPGGRRRSPTHAVRRHRISRGHFRRFVLPEGRRRIALPYLPASISFRGVELAFNTARDSSATRPGVAATTKTSRGRVPNRRPSKCVQARAYSSIGQSPRLITGLFLVRTQVGPLTPSAPLVMQSQAIARFAACGSLGCLSGALAPDPAPASRAVRGERNWLEVREEPF